MPWHRVLTVCVCAALPVALAACEPAEVRACRTAPTFDCAIERALAEVEAIEDPVMRAMADAYVARVLADAGLPAEARARIDAVLSATPDPAGAQGGANPLPIAARTLAILGDVEGARAVADDIVDAYNAALARASIAASLARAGRRSEAMVSLDRALDAAPDLTEAQRPYIFAYAALAMSAMGDAALARDMAETAIRKAEALDPAARARVLAVGGVAQWMAGAGGDADRSLRRIDTILAVLDRERRHPAHTSTVLGFLAWARAETGDRTGAQEAVGRLAETLGELREPRFRALAFSVIALALAKVGDPPPRP